MKIITIASLKGGVGKTTTAVYLSMSMCARKQRVLAIDLDPNNNLTDFFLRSAYPEEIETRNVKQLLSGELPAKDCIHNATGISIIPCTVSLHTAAHELSRSPATILRFAAMLRKLSYDVVIIDTPPFPGYELSLALHASDAILSPVALSRWTVQAYTALEAEIQTVSEGTGKKPATLALPVLVSEREEKILRSSFNGTPVTRSAIHRAAVIRSASEKGSALRTNTKSEAEFINLAKEVMEC